MFDKEGQAVLLAPLIIDLRVRRKPFDERWLDIHAAYKGKPTRSFFVSEIFKHYLPQLRRSIEKFVIRVAQMLVPTPDFFEVFPSDERTSDEQAQLVRSYFSYLFLRRIKIYNLARVLGRSYALYGRAIVKSSVEVVEAVLKDKSGQDVPVRNVWPTARAVDPFSFYVFPETVTDLDKAQMLVEDIMMPYNQYQSFSDNKTLNITPIPQSALTSPEWPETWQRRLQQVPLTTPDTIAVGTSQDDPERPKQLVDFVALTEVWKKIGATWHRLWIVWNATGGPYCVRLDKLDLTRPAYRMAAARDIPGEHYGTGMGDDLEPLQILLNDQINMALEGQVMQFAPPAVIDPDLVSRPASIVFRPRAKWLMKPDGVKWLEVKGDNVARAGLQGMQFTMGLMDQFAGSTPLSDGQPQRNMPRAGFALQSLMNLSLTDVKDAAMMMETEILSPLMGDLYYLTMRFVPDSQKIRIPGGMGVNPATHKVEDMYGDFDFNWVGSLQAQDTQVRAQRLIQTLGILAKLAPIMNQQLLLQGKTMDWEYMMRRVWREGLGERGAGSFIRQMTPQEMQAVQAMMAQQQAEKQAELAAKSKGAGEGADVEGTMQRQIQDTVGG